MRLVDFVDMSYQEDPTWDLGKWLNYVKRFYKVAFFREQKQLDTEVKISISQSRINLYDHHQSRVRPEVLEKPALKIFSRMTELDQTRLRSDSALAEFIVNVYTLPRHIRYYPHVVKNILSCICESYCQLQKSSLNF